MKFTYNWLKDFADIKIPAQALADKLTMAGLEVASIEERGGDFVFEVEVTSNRPDWLCVAGIAREAAAITGKRLSGLPVISLSQENKKTRKQESKLTINIQSKKECPLYSAKIIRDIKVGASPDWLRKRLELIGVRSVNNIVDITNYILFTFGEPLHAFDLDRFVTSYQSPVTSQKIVVRRARLQEEIITIDGIKRVLGEDVLIIASGFSEEAGRPIAIAGIMGGKETEVTFNTKNILLEAAVFDPMLIRRSRRKLGMQTDSSYRFERGIAADTAINASWQAARMIRELCGGEVICAKSAGALKAKAKGINISTEDVVRVLGVTIPAARVKKIFSGLGFKVSTKAKNAFSVYAPPFRQDIFSKEDLIEEVARIYGYGSIPSTFPSAPPGTEEDKGERLVSLTKGILTGLGLNEAITYSLIEKDLLSVFAKTDAIPPIQVRDPLSKEQEALRPTAIPSLCQRVAYNLNQKQEYINLFEVSRAFLGGAKKPREELMLTIALCGEKAYILKDGIVREKACLLDLKGIMQALLEGLGVKGFQFKTEQGRAVIYLAQEKIAEFFQLGKKELERLEIKNREVFVLEASLEKIFSGSCLEKKFSALPRYPGITRDISFVIKESVSAGEVLDAAKTAGGQLLKEVKIADYYKGKQVPDGFRALTVSCFYLSQERTLAESEVNPLHAAVSGILTERLGAKIR